MLSFFLQGSKHLRLRLACLTGTGTLGQDGAVPARVGAGSEGILFISKGFCAGSFAFVTSGFGTFFDLAALPALLPP